MNSMMQSEASIIATEMLALPSAARAVNVAVMASNGHWGLLFLQPDGATQLHPCAPAKLHPAGGIQATAAYWAFLSHVADLVRHSLHYAYDPPLPRELYPALQRT